MKEKGRCHVQTLGQTVWTPYTVTDFTSHGLLALPEVLLICGISHYSQAVAMSHSQASCLREKQINWFHMCIFLWFTILLFHFTCRFLAVYAFIISCIWGVCRKHWEFWLAKWQNNTWNPGLHLQVIPCLVHLISYIYKTPY